MGRPFFAYMLQCADESYYVGHPEELERRTLEHHEGGKCAATETRRPVRLTWSPECATREEALAAELRIKNWSRATKPAWARGDCDDLSKAAKKKDWAAYRQRRQRL